MKLEPANIICPKCGNGNYMRHLIGENVGRLDVKCINCNSYFSFEELSKQKVVKDIKPVTTPTKIRGMIDEKLAEMFSRLVNCDCCPCRSPNDTCNTVDGICQKQWLEWMKRAVE